MFLRPTGSGGGGYGLWNADNPTDLTNFLSGKANITIGEKTNSCAYLFSGITNLGSLSLGGSLYVPEAVNNCSYMLSNIRNLYFNVFDLSSKADKHGLFYNSYLNYINDSQENFIKNNGNYCGMFYGIKEINRITFNILSDKYNVNYCHLFDTITMNINCFNFYNITGNFAYMFANSRLTNTTGVYLPNFTNVTGNFQNIFYNVNFNGQHIYINNSLNYIPSSQYAFTDAIFNSSSSGGFLNIYNKNTDFSYGFISTENKNLAFPNTSIYDSNLNLYHAFEGRYVYNKGLTISNSNIYMYEAFNNHCYTPNLFNFTVKNSIINSALMFSSSRQTEDRMWVYLHFNNVDGNMSKSFLNKDVYWSNGKIDSVNAYELFADCNVTMNYNYVNFNNLTNVVGMFMNSYVIMKNANNYTPSSDFYMNNSNITNYHNMFRNAKMWCLNGMIGVPDGADCSYMYYDSWNCYFNSILNEYLISKVGNYYNFDYNLNINAEYMFYNSHLGISLENRSITDNICNNIFIGARVSINNRAASSSNRMFGLNIYKNNSAYLFYQSNFIMYNNARIYIRENVINCSHMFYCNYMRIYNNVIINIYDILNKNIDNMFSQISTSNSIKFYSCDPEKAKNCFSTDFYPSIDWTQSGNNFYNTTYNFYLNYAAI